MSFLNKHKTEAVVNTAPAADGLTGTAEDVDVVMKKYDRESMSVYGKESLKP